MQKRRDIVTPIVVSLIILSSLTSGTLVLIFKDQIIGQAITTMTAVIGACVIWLQMRKNKRLNEGEFIVNLNKQFIENKAINTLFLKLEKYERSDKETNPFSEEDIADIAAYMTFFEVIYSLIVRDIIEIWMIDDLFSYQFFLLLNNPRIQALELLPCQKYYINVFRLARIWKTYRDKNGDDILNNETNILNVITLDLDGK